MPANISIIESIEQTHSARIVSSTTRLTALLLFPLPSESDPKAALGYTKRAAAYLQQRKNNEALSDLDLAVEVDPTFLQGYLHRGRLLRQTCQ